MSRDRIADAITQMTMGMNWRLDYSEVAAYAAMMAQKKQSLKSRMRIEFKQDAKAYLVHDLMDNSVYYLDDAHVPEWARDGMALLNLLPAESELDNVGFFYAPGIYYLEIKSSVPEAHRRHINAREDGT